MIRITMDTKIGEMLADLLENGQAISMCAFSPEQGAEPAAVLVLAQAPYAEVIQKLVAAIGGAVVEEEQGHLVSFSYDLTSESGEDA